MKLTAISLILSNADKLEWAELEENLAFEVCHILNSKLTDFHS